MRLTSQVLRSFGLSSGFGQATPLAHSKRSMTRLIDEGDDAGDRPPRRGAAEAVQSRLCVDTSGISQRAVVSYQRVGIPAAAEAEEWVAGLQAVPPTGEAVNVSMEVDFAVRYCMLAYTRNDAVAAQSAVLHSRSSGSPEVVELQFHGSDDFARGAHMVAYLYRLGKASKAEPGGVGVVMAFKGSTANTEDWKHNFSFLSLKSARGPPGSLSFGVDLFPSPEHSTDYPCLHGVQCHGGFLKYKHSLDERMRQFSMAPLQGLLADWGAPCDAPHFLAWLRSGVWRWCVVTGHSLGGAMAAITATELSVRAAKPALLATLGSAIAGNEAFVSLQNKVVRPAGGLRIYNTGDPVPHLGYSGVRLACSKAHGGQPVGLRGRWLHSLDSYHLHLRFTVPSTCVCDSDEGTELLCSPTASPTQGCPKMVTFKFPGSAYRPSAVAARSSEFSLGDNFS